MNRPTFRDKKPNEDYMNRRLIRPSLADLKDKMTVRSQKRKPAPQEQTNAESFYYLKQMQNKTPMVVVLDDGIVRIARKISPFRPALSPLES
jgi:hypothetical protein